MSYMKHAVNLFTFSSKRHLVLPHLLGPALILLATATSLNHGGFLPNCEKISENFSYSVNSNTV